jgi:hypothetical protein
MLAAMGSEDDVVDTHYQWVLECIADPELVSVYALDENDALSEGIDKVILEALVKCEYYIQLIYKVVFAISNSCE